jgi:hypothetical protein
MDILCFKERKDLEIWRAGKGSYEIRRRITWANIYLLQLTAKSATVTAWLKDSLFHKDLEAFDLRVRDLDKATLRAWMMKMHEDKIPCHLIDADTSNAHLHVGELATLKYEKELTE